jgi:hypothetical protein
MADRLGVVVRICHSATQEVEIGGSQSEASLNKNVSPYLKNTES